MWTHRAVWKLIGNLCVCVCVCVCDVFAVCFCCLFLLICIGCNRHRCIIEGNVISSTRQMGILVVRPRQPITAGVSLVNNVLLETGEQRPPILGFKECVAAGQCSRNCTGKRFELQPWFRCVQCNFRFDCCSLNHRVFLTFFFFFVVLLVEIIILDVAILARKFVMRDTRVCFCTRTELERIVTVSGLLLLLLFHTKIVDILNFTHFRS
jgi:hypothetical protein